MRRTRILFLIDELDIGGTEQQIFELATRINRDKYSPHVCCFRKGRVAREIEEAGIPVFHLVKRGKADLPFLLRLAGLLKEQRIDLLQTYLFTANTWGHVAARLAGVPIIVSSERNVDIWEKRYKRWSGLFLSRSSSAVTVNAEAIKRYLTQRGARAEKIVTVHNGVNSARFEGLPDLSAGAQAGLSAGAQAGLSAGAQAGARATRAQLGIAAGAPVIASVARLEPQKGHAILLRSARLILDEVPQARFLVIGDGPERDRLERLARTLGIAKSVIFTGATREVPKLLHASDVSVLASIKEGMSNSLLESMALGKPVVATDVGGNSEIVADGATGFLVPRNDPKALALACLRVLRDRKLSASLGEKARERARERFSVPRMVRSTEDLYERLVSSELDAPTFFFEKDDLREDAKHAKLGERNPRQIAFVVSQFPQVVDIYFLRELKWLKRHGFEIDLFSLRSSSKGFVHEEAREFLPRTTYSPFLFSLKLVRAQWRFLRGSYWSALFRVVAGTYRSPGMLFKALAIFPKSVYFAQIIEEQGKGHVHANWATHPTVSAMVISRLTGIPFSFAGHASDIFLDTTMLAEKLKEAKFVVTCTRYNSEYLARLCNGGRPARAPAGGPVAIHPVHHGLDLAGSNSTASATHSGFRVLSVGSLRECKGYPTLIESCRLLKERDIDFHCEIVGGGPERKKLERLISRYGLEGRVCLTPYLAHEELIPRYHRADVVALPALSESHFGIPNVLIESLAAKTPVICTSLPSIPELIEHNTSGLIVPERDPDALADALESLASDPELRKRLGEEGYARVARDFDIEKSGRQLEKIFLS